MAKNRVGDRFLQWVVNGRIGERRGGWGSGRVGEEGVESGRGGEGARLATKLGRPSETVGRGRRGRLRGQCVAMADRRRQRWAQGRDTETREAGDGALRSSLVWRRKGVREVVSSEWGEREAEDVQEARRERRDWRTLACGRTRA